MTEIKDFGFYKTSNPWLQEHLKNSGFIPEKTEKKIGSNRICAFYQCSDELRISVQQYHDNKENK